MRQTYQFSIFGSLSGKGLLFPAAIRGQYLDDARTIPIPDKATKLQTIRNWLAAVAESGGAEASLEARFLQDVMVSVLGYELYPSGGGRASLYPKPPSRHTHIGRTPDGMLGQFEAERFVFTAALELKSPGTDLDLPQARENAETPVEQGFYYGKRILGVRWVLVTDMKTLRLYSVESPVEYEEFELEECVSEDGEEKDAFRRLYFLLHHDYLVAGHANSPVAALYDKTTERQIAIREGFYGVYYEIRADLYEALRRAVEILPMALSHSDLLQATQRLLDRVLFICYCEDHPQQLIPAGTLERVTTAARDMPGQSSSKVFDSLKALFHEVDVGSPPFNRVQIPGYNGELFKPHPVIDSINLHDALHDRAYFVEDGGARRRRIAGVWGLHAFDFWQELNEHLLGHIFEESLSDLDQLGSGVASTAVERMRERKRNGVFYTSSLLSDFLADSAIAAVLNERVPLDAESPAALQESLGQRLEALLSLRVLDPACGSGAFLVSAFRNMQEEYWRLRAMLAGIQRPGATPLFDDLAAQDQALLLHSCLFGIDLLPQAVEIAKLALWLRSARKGEKVADLGGNIVPGDSLRLSTFADLLHAQPGAFDLVIGNPPWGGEIEAASYEEALTALGIGDEGWDSWELFVLLGLRALRDGGRLAFVLPDSFLYSDKARLRSLLCVQARLEKVHGLGPDWFGQTVRMGTVLLQARRGSTPPDADMVCSLIAGVHREQAISGQLPLTQLEASRGRLVPVARTLSSPEFSIELARGRRDDALIDRMISRSVCLSDLCEHGRGEEMNKAGLAWVCPGCLAPNTPGKKEKGGGFKAKRCQSCGLEIDPNTVQVIELVVAGAGRPGGEFVPFVDGDDVSRRYLRVQPSKWLHTGLSGWDYKGAELYRSPKVLIRQAGVGIVATLDETDARCPQSLYVYRVLPDWQEQGYSHEYLLGSLLSRTMAYIVFKLFSEVDPDKAHAKLTHSRLARLPIPRVEWGAADHRRAHETVVRNVRMLLDGSASLGGVEDRDIELALRHLWGITPEDGAYINAELRALPDSQVLRDLFPNEGGVVASEGAAEPEWVGAAVARRRAQ